jgi:intracellular sulfur oxidation DsrE/DsrF family protein
LKQRKIEKKQILSAATYVPVGIAELVLKQEAGYAYIKAGF